MLPIEDIQTYGGKAAILNHVRDNAPNLPIPKYVTRKKGQWLWSIRRDLRELEYPLIVRSSSPHEYGDFEGIFDSIPNVKDKNSLREAIRRVELGALSERAKTYANQNGFQIDSDLHMIIQEQSNSEYAGVMMRHPNEPDLVYMDLYKGRSHNRDHKLFVFNTKTREQVKKQRYKGGYDMSLDEACFLADVYEQIESLGEIAEEHSLFIEFGFNPFALYQVRPFKKIETADFEIPEVEDGIKTDVTFGITPPDGIVFPVLRTFNYKQAITLMSRMRSSILSGNPSVGGISWGQLDHQLVDFFMDSALARPHSLATSTIEAIKKHNQRVDSQLRDYCVVTEKVDTTQYDFDLTVPHMKAFVGGGLEKFLSHGVIRLLKKADVALEAGWCYSLDLFKLSTSGENIRIISNGKEAVAFRE